MGRCLFERSCPRSEAEAGARGEMDLPWNFSRRQSREIVTIYSLFLILPCAYIDGVKLISIYRCLCDETRLRILNMLAVSPLCVCHIQSVLGRSQVVVSQHLAYLRERGMVAGQRYQNWMIYSLPAKASKELEANLKCLQDCVQEEPVFQKDRAKLKKLMGSKTVKTLLDLGCCIPPAAKAVSKPVSRRKTSTQT